MKNASPSPISSIFKTTYIKIVFQGLEFSIYLANVQAQSITDDIKMLLEDSILSGCDEASILLLNNLRITEQIKIMVPDKY